jgi:transcription antitermination protein NusB
VERITPSRRTPEDDGSRIAIRGNQMGARRKARELALQMLFQYDMSGNSPDQIVETFEELQKSKANTREFAEKIFRGTVNFTTSIDEMIQQQAENWRLSRMAAVDRNIIRMSIYEFLHENDTPKLVIIDEAIEIAKRFGTQKSPQFINGILDGILKRYNLASDDDRGQKAEGGK